MSSFPWVKFTAMTTGLVGLGYGIMKVAVPTEEELYNRMAPDLRKNVDAIRAARLAQENAAAKQADLQTTVTDPDAQKPIWAEPPKKA